MNKWLRRSAFIFMLTIAIALTAFADQDKESMGCRDKWENDRFTHCEIQEQTLAPSGTLAVDARQNGGVSVKGWDRNEILVRARIQASGTSQADADALAKQVHIETSGSKIFATGPENRREAYWSVSYEIFVPRRSDLSLVSHNGGISIVDVQGRLDFTAVNGGVSLRHVGGAVHGGTTNGGLSIELTGDRWDGEEMDVKTTNGGINMSVPENYSAHLETGTVNGHINVDFPVSVHGEINRRLSIDLRSGGALVRAVTTNGGVSIQRKSM